MTQASPGFLLSLQYCGYAPAKHRGRRDSRWLKQILGADHSPLLSVLEREDRLGGVKRGHRAAQSRVFLADSAM